MPLTDARRVKRPLRLGRQRAEKLPLRSATACATVVHVPVALKSWISTVRPLRRAGIQPRRRSDRLTSAPGFDVRTTSPEAGAAAPPLGTAVPPVETPAVARSAAACAGRASAPAASRAQTSVACRRASLIVVRPTG